jgi:GNAT superfamily N-acetyltransferase
MDYRKYDPEKDSKAAHRIWYEVGWMSEEKEEKSLDIFLAGSDVLVADINGEAECLVASAPGDIRYQEETLPLAIVACVTTSRIARKQGFASRLTARLLALQAEQGAAVSALGMFEQGFYNQLGFGTGSYEHAIRFDPAALNISVNVRPPQRLTSDDFEEVHAALLNRSRRHGACNISPVSFTQSELAWGSKGFGLGFHDGENGELTHFFWCWPKGEHGPYRIGFMAYQDADQFMELMGLIKNIGDQVRTVRMREPAHVQIQDLVKQPFRRDIVSEKTDHSTGTSATADWQMRILDLEVCLAKTHLSGEPVRFNLSLTDPVERFLDNDTVWQGISGEYVVTLGPDSSAAPGVDDSLPTLTASVGAFTRLWLGVRPPTGLAITDELVGPESLLQALDAVLCLPVPHPDWDF